MIQDDHFHAMADIRAAAGMNWEAKVSEISETIRRLKRGHDRYEKVRKLNVKQFADLYALNIHGGGAFDDLVDQL